MKKVHVILLLFCGFFSEAQISISGCYLSGALVNQGPNGCGNAPNYCNLASIFVPAFSPTACGTTTSSGSSTMNISSNLILPAGCTATVDMEFRPRNYYGVSVAQGGNGCSNSGMDGSPDGMSITNSGGAIASQGSTLITSNSPTCSAYPALGTYTTAVASLTSGCSNATGILKMVVTGGTVTINGRSNRGDEIVTYTINLSGAGCGPSCELVLPIELLGFSGAGKDNSVQLQWLVASEENLGHYLIEKSADALNWTELITVIPNSRTSSQFKEYQTTDEYPLKGINYYRLTNFNTDGSSDPHPIIAVHYSGKSDPFWFYQNEEDLIIYSDESLANASLNLYDISGRLVKKMKNPRAGGVRLSKYELREGLYLLGCEDLPQLGKCKVLVY